MEPNPKPRRTPFDPKPKPKPKPKPNANYVPSSRAERHRADTIAALTRGRRAAAAAASSSPPPQHIPEPDFPFHFPPQPQHPFQTNQPPPKIIPFRDPYKLVNLYRLGYATVDDISKVHRIPRYIPKKQKRFMYYHVHGLNTWMIDIVFIKTDGSVWDLSEADATILAQAQSLEERPDAPINDEDRRHFSETADKILKENRCKKVLLCIHCNSRFTLAFIIDDQKATTLAPCISFLQNNWHCDTIISDAQASIAKAINDINGNDPRVADAGVIKHIKLNMSAGNNRYFHTMLSLVDRMCRTLRDMIYNAKFHNPTLEVDNRLLFKLCEIYNNVVHERLSEIMEFPITPQQMFDHERIQLEYIRRASAHNYRIKDINGTIPLGEIVRVYNKPEPFKKRRNTVEDDEYEVLGYDGRYYLRNLKTGLIGKYVRSQIVRY